VRALRVIVADDEPAARRGLRHMLHEQGVTVVADAADGLATVAAVVAHAPDALFLDIQMPGLTGLAIGEALEARGVPVPRIVFVTAYDEFAVRAFERNALDYLLKPISEERVRTAIERCREASEWQQDRGLRLALEALMHGTPSADRLVIPEGTRVAIVPTSDVVWIEADDYYVTVYTTTRSHLWRESLTALESRLDPVAFARVHRSAIVRVDQVRAMRVSARGGLILSMSTGQIVPVSRKYRTALRTRFGQLPRRVVSG
jgi:two-component system, LytTR family, response regulator